MNVILLKGYDYAQERVVPQKNKIIDYETVGSAIQQYLIPAVFLFLARRRYDRVYEALQQHT